MKTMTGSRAPKKVLVLCTGNSCRSQMAEGFINHLLRGRWEARSAGTAPAAGVHPLAVAVMAEVGIDISRGRPTRVDEVLDRPWDLVITVCDSARETCPVFPRQVEQIHVGFPDPAAVTGTEAERLAAFRRIRDAIRERLIPELERRA